MNYDVERCEIYYRVSDRLPWTLLGIVTAEDVQNDVNKRIDQSGLMPLEEQRYQITKLPDGDALPEFNEIQYRFRLFNGMSIIGAWHEYEYLTRNTVK